MNKKNSVLILLSGGVDSTALIHYYLTKKFDVQGIYFNYGQDANVMEQTAVNRVSQYYNIKNEIIDLGLLLNQKNGEYYGRNALFVLAAASIKFDRFKRIAIGVHKGVAYYDCSELFINDCQNILDGYFSGIVMLDAPFLMFTKRQIYEYCIENAVPLDLTYSCEKGFNKPCGICPSCKDRSLLNELLHV